MDRRINKLWLYSGNGFSLDEWVGRQNKIRWQRLRWRRCGKSTVLLKEILDLKAYQSKMARIIIKRFTSAAQWEKYCKGRLKSDGKVIMLLIDV